MEDDHGHITPSAFIPFCSIGSNMSLLGTYMEKISHPICKAFKPKMLEGQKCYELDLTNMTDTVTFTKGEINGLTFLMDYNEDRAINEKFQEGFDGTLATDEASIYVDTLGSEQTHDQNNFYFHQPLFIFISILILIKILIWRLIYLYLDKIAQTNLAHFNYLRGKHGIKL